MNETARKLMDAHVAFELRQWRGKALEKHVRQEVSQVWAWAERTPLRTALDATQVRNAVSALLRGAAPGDELAAAIGDVAAHLLAHPDNPDTRVADVVDRELFDEGVDLTVALSDLRTRLLHRVLHSSFYRLLASDLLYRGIRDYLFSDQALLQRIPGVSSLLKRGAGRVSRHLPGLEAEVEKRVRAYLEANLERTLNRSEAFLLDTLTEARIRELAEEIWEHVGDRPLALDEPLTDDEIDAMARFGVEVWRHLCDAPHVRTLVEAAVDRFHARWADRPLAEVLTQLGLDRTTVRREALTLLPPLVKSLCEGGYLESVIRRRLEAFYGSAEVERLLAGARGD